jgi:transposase
MGINKPKPTRDEMIQLYEVERLSTREIAKMYDVQHITVRRWLDLYGMKPRASGKGLANRGIEPPSRDDLFRMIHVEHLGYVGVAAKYGVDSTAVPYWLKKHGIERPKVWETRYGGNAPEIDPDQVRTLYESGVSLKDIGKRFGVSELPIRTLARELGLKVKKNGFNGGIRYTCQNGLEVRSVYEQRVADWFIENNVRFDYEPLYPFGMRWRADFHANGWYVEIWGVVGSESYDKKKQRKVELCEINKIPLLQLKPHQFNTEQGHLMGKILSAVFEPPEIQGLLF